MPKISIGLFLFRRSLRVRISFDFFIRLRHDFDICTTQKFKSVKFPYFVLGFSMTFKIVHKGVQIGELCDLS